MPDLFTPYTLKGVTLRNRIAMSPMTMYRSVDGRMDDFHLMYLGARAAGGFGLVFPEQVAIAPGSELKPWVANELGRQLPPDHPEGWQCVGPSDVPYGFGKRPFPVHALSTDEIAALHRQYADAARRALEAGYQWLEMHFAHGYPAASSYSPLANRRDDAYRGSLENRARFLVEAMDAVREVWPEEYPLTARLGSDDYHPDGVAFEESVQVVAWLKEHGLDLADLSFGGNTDDMTDPFFPNVSAWVERGARVRREVDIPVTVSWNLGVPESTDRAIRDEKIDLVMLGRPALANAHWPVWAARELGHPDAFSLVPEDRGWWLSNFRGHDPSIGWPASGASAAHDQHLRSA